MMMDDGHETLIGLPFVETEEMDSGEPLVFGPPMVGSEQIARIFDVPPWLISGERLPWYRRAAYRIRRTIRTRRLRWD